MLRSALALRMSRLQWKLKPETLPPTRGHRTELSSFKAPLLRELRSFCLSGGLLEELTHTIDFIRPDLGSPTVSSLYPESVC